MSLTLSNVLWAGLGACIDLGIYCRSLRSYSSCGLEDIERILRLQNSAVRFVFCSKRFDHVSSHRDAANDHVSFNRHAANTICVERVCRIIAVCMIHKVLKFGEPLYLCEKLVQRQEVSQRSSRQDNQFHFPRVRLEVGRRSFSYFGLKLYNDLPGSLKSTQPYFSVGIKKNLYHLVVKSLRMVMQHFLPRVEHKPPVLVVEESQYDMSVTSLPISDWPRPLFHPVDDFCKGRYRRESLLIRSSVSPPLFSSNHKYTYVISLLILLEVIFCPYQSSAVMVATASLNNTSSRLVNLVKLFDNRLVHSRRLAISWTSGSCVKLCEAESNNESLNTTIRPIESPSVCKFQPLLQIRTTSSGV
ncbi:hypothetical protein J6590_033860 [Homalodisca vitripennis]|nr:hypothetical protein J6590_033860 [Homalodisca vitripennis]